MRLARDQGKATSDARAIKTSWCSPLSAIAQQPSAVFLFRSLGLTERAHYRNRVIAHPEIIGPGVLTIAFEFDRWTTSNGPAPKDRLDVLGLDRDGRLVVAELKRGVAPDTVDVQAIKYAAMVSRFTEETLADLYAEFLLKTEGSVLNGTEALERLLSPCDSRTIP